MERTVIPGRKFSMLKFQMNLKYMISDHVAESNGQINDLCHFKYYSHSLNKQYE